MLTLSLSNNSFSMSKSLIMLCEISIIHINKSCKMMTKTMSHSKEWNHGTFSWCSYKFKS